MLSKYNIKSEFRYVKNIMQGKKMYSSSNVGNNMNAIRKLYMNMFDFIITCKQ